MLVRQGDARSDEVDRRLACALASVAGALNAAVFQAVGFFSANMTGNVSALSESIATGDLARGAVYCALLLAFVTGAAVSTLAVNAGRRRGSAGIYAWAILGEALLLALLGGAVFCVPALQRGVTLVAALSFLMGFQNATVTRISNGRVRTTHVSGASTDIGIAIGMLLDRGGGADTQPVRARLRLYGVTIVSFLLGGVAGVLVYRLAGGVLLLGCAGVLLCFAVPNLVRARRLGGDGLLAS